MKFERASGVLLHPTCFPGDYGIGDLGAEAYNFVDFLHETGQKLWQILPLNPTGYGDSPYSGFSAFAGNPLLISPDILLGQTFLDLADLQEVPDFPTDRVDFGPVIEWKMKLLERSFELFQERAAPEVRAQLSAFEVENAGWLEDFAMFMAAKAAHGGVVWSEWEEGLARREPDALVKWHTQLVHDIAFQKYLQFTFFDQWQSLRLYATERGVKVMGDIPIFVAYDSAEVWAHPDLFYLDEKGQATVVAGVPPDYFSATGQRWGNPLYRWDVLDRTGYAWWIERFQTTFKLVDIVRLDHFRGFEAYWEIPAQEETAVKGRWVKGPRDSVFKAVFAALGEKPIIAEDLGIITPEMEALRDGLGIPGMKVLQFAFASDATDIYLPHNIQQPNVLLYSGTHDNDTTAGWFSQISPTEQQYVLRYLGDNPQGEYPPSEIAWKLVRLAWSSVANLAVAPLQDLLGLGNEARMNKPGSVGGNWDWRYQPDNLNEELKGRLQDITVTYGRYVPAIDEAQKATMIDYRKMPEQ